MLSRSVTSDGPLRVLFVVPVLGVGGAERHVLTLMTHLDPERFAPALLCIGPPGRLFAEVEAAGLPARALGRTRSQLPLALWELVVHLRRTRPDVVVMRGANAEGMGRAAAVLAGVPRTVIWVHNNADLTPRPLLRRLADRVLEPVTSAYYGVAHGQLPYLTETLGYPADKIRIIHNGVDPTRFTPRETDRRDPALAAELGVDPDDFLVGIIAVLRPEKDHAMFLRAARLVLDREPRARFLVVGRGVLADDLRAMAEDLGLGDRVVFTGVRDDVAQIMALLDVVVLCSWTEAFPMAVLEAMAVGRPTVCTAVGGIPEMVEDGTTGFLVPPRDPQTLAERLIELAADRARARGMGRAALTRLRADFTLERSVERAEQALAETAGRAAAGV